MASPVFIVGAAWATMVIATVFAIALGRASGHSDHLREAGEGTPGGHVRVTRASHDYPTIATPWPDRTPIAAPRPGRILGRPSSPRARDANIA
jgi:hypothetical protein